jgi:secondary thiamine-phosphate synthase enzyme
VAAAFRLRPQGAATFLTSDLNDPRKQTNQNMQTLQIKTTRRTQFVDITDEVQSAVTKSQIKSGICHVYVPHTTAAVTINEHADPDVASDVEAAFDRLIPHRGPYKHGEGNSDSHIKSILVGNTQTVFISDGRLALGRWQGIFFCEFDGPRTRQLHLKIIPDHA